MADSDPRVPPSDSTPEPKPTQPIPADPVDPAPVAAQVQQSTPIVHVAPEPPTTQNPIPAMNNAKIANLFNRMDRDERTFDHVVDVNAQDTLSGEVYDQLAIISSVTLPITRANFIRMWKTLILKRTQDVYEQEYLTRPEHYVRVSRTVNLPAPLADLLHALGSFYSHHTGRQHNITQPARAAAPPNWWNVDQALLRDWMATTTYMNKVYVMKEYPSQRETEAKPIVLTFKQTVGTKTRIKALTNEPTLSDGFIRLVNNELFTAHDRFTADICALNMTMDLNENNIRGRYVAGYVTRHKI